MAVILSRKHEFIFIKARKVAGTSVEIALATICGPDDIITPLGQPDEVLRIGRGMVAQNYSDDREAERRYIEKLKETPPERIASVKWPAGRYGNHMRLSQVLDLAGDVAGYRTVGIVRNPYGKVLSLANMRAANGFEYRRTGVYQATEEERRHALDDLIRSTEFRKLRSEKQYRGPGGKHAMDVLLRYERLADDFAAFVRSLGVEDPPELPHVKKGIMADRLDPRHEMTPAQIRAVNTMFAAEFSAFGYEMVEP